MRDWFKDRRTEDEAPTIVEEKKSELFLSNGNTMVNIKQEPLEEETAPNNFEKVANTVDAEVVKVKMEPVEEEEEVEGSVSAVLRSKVRSFLNALNSIFSAVFTQATFLTSLTKKIENASKPVEDEEAEKNQVN